MRNKNDKNIDKLINFIEEFSWLLESYKGLKIEDSLIQVKNIIDANNLYSISDKLYENRSTGMRTLVGILPELFQNKTLFPSNSSIIEFANEVLRMNINPAKKRSKTEIIGEIVCTTYVLSNKDIDKIVKALNNMLNNESIMHSVKELKNDCNLTWNDIIQRLAY